MKKIVYRVYYPVCEGGGNTYEDFEDTDKAEVLAAVEGFCANFRKDDVMVCCISNGEDIPPVKRATFNPTITQLKSMTVSYMDDVSGDEETMHIAFPFYETKRGDGGLVPFVDVHANNKHVFGAFVRVRPDVANDAWTFAYEFVKAYRMAEHGDIGRDVITDIEYEFK